MHKTLLIVVTFFTLFNVVKAEQLPLRIVADDRKLLQYEQNGHAKGPSAELLNRLLNEAGLKGHIEFMPWSRAFKTAKNRPNTLLLTTIRTPEREGNFHWLLKVSDVRKSFISLKHLTNNHVNSLEQAKEKLVAVVRGTASHQFLQAKGFAETNNLYVVASVEETIEMLLNEKVDLIFTPPAVLANYFAAKNQDAKELIYYSIFPDIKREGFIVINKHSDQALVDRLKKASNAVSQSEDYQALVDYKPLLTK